MYICVCIICMYVYVTCVCICVYMHTDRLHGKNINRDFNFGIQNHLMGVPIVAQWVKDLALCL